MRVLDKIECSLGTRQLAELYGFAKFDKTNTVFQRIELPFLQKLHHEGHIDIYQPFIRDDACIASFCISNWKRNRGSVYMVDEDLYEKLHEEPCDPNLQHEKDHTKMVATLAMMEKLNEEEKEVHIPLVVHEINRYYGNRDSWKILDKTYPEFNIDEGAFVKFPESSKYFGALVTPSPSLLSDFISEPLKTRELYRHAASYVKRNSADNEHKLQRVMNEYRTAVYVDHCSHSFTYHKKQSKFYTIVLIADAEDYLVMTLSNDGIASNTQNFAVDEVRFLYNFFYCLGRSTTVVNKQTKKVYERSGKLRRRKMVRRSYRTISIDDETLSVIKKKSFAETETREGGSKCRHERSATKANVWVKSGSLKSGEVVIATKTSLAGNKLFLVKRSRAGTVVNSHLKEVAINPNPIIKVRSF